jgi:hypothetical protein
MEVYLHAFLAVALVGGKWSALHLSHLTFWGRSSQYPLDRRLDGPQSQSECSDKKDKITFIALAWN